MSPPIHPLASSQGAVFLVNSCQRYFSCGLSCERQALFRSYGCFFAEFLGDFSLVRLRLLDENTCVGLRYGLALIMLRSFSWRIALRRLREPKLPHSRSPWGSASRIYLRDPLSARTSHPIARGAYLSPSLHRMRARSRNINRVSIGCGSRHCLRPD